MLGAFSVGKSSLVRRYVQSIFSDSYLSTVGVKISKKVVEHQGVPISLLLWDMEGKDDYSDIEAKYLRGAMGFLLVADGVWDTTLDVCLSIRELALQHLGKKTPHLLLVNKADLIEDWTIRTEQLDALQAQGLTVIKTSAKTGMGVNDAFSALTKAMLLESDLA